jgi:hypothetical protein
MGSNKQLALKLPGIRQRKWANLNGMTKTATVTSATESETMKDHQLEPRFRISGFLANVVKTVKLNNNVRKMINAISVAINILLK